MNDKFKELDRIGSERNIKLKRLGCSGKRFSEELVVVEYQKLF